MPESYTCAKCGKVAKTKQALERHAAYHEDDRPFSCEVCLQRFKNSDDRGKHYRRLKRDGKFAFACKVCHKHFRSQDLLSKHWEILGCLLKQVKPADGGAESRLDGKTNVMENGAQNGVGELVLNNDVQCSCKICEVEFIGTDNLKKHYKDVHKDTKRQVCIQCGQTLSSKDSLARHYSIFHQNNYPFQCEFCDQKFKIKESLCRHVKFVHKDGGYPCEICKRVFSQPVNLKKHMAMHSSSLEFACDVCGREFRWKQAFQKHMMLHGSTPSIVKHENIEDVNRPNELGDTMKDIFESPEKGRVSTVLRSSEQYSKNDTCNTLQQTSLNSDPYVFMLKGRNSALSVDRQVSQSSTTISEPNQIRKQIDDLSQIVNSKVEISDSCRLFRKNHPKDVKTGNKDKTNATSSTDISKFTLSGKAIGFPAQKTRINSANDIEGEDIGMGISRGHSKQVYKHSIGLAESKGIVNDEDIMCCNNTETAKMEVDCFSDAEEGEDFSTRNRALITRKLGVKHKHQADSVDVNMTLSCKKAKICDRYKDNKDGEAKKNIESPVISESDRNTDSQAKKKEMYLTSMPTSQETNAPSFFFKPSSIQNILKDKSKQAEAERGEKSGFAAGENRKAEFRVLMETASNATRKTNNPFLIPYTSQSDTRADEEEKSESANNVGSECKNGSQKIKQIPKIQGAYKFSLVKHMLSLQNEENFDKELFRNPLYCSPADIKGLTDIVERHRVEDNGDIYDLSARQICPFQWLGVRVNKQNQALSKDRTVKDDSIKPSQSVGVMSPASEKSDEAVNSENELDVTNSESGENGVELDRTPEHITRYRKKIELTENKLQNPALEQNNVSSGSKCSPDGLLDIEPAHRKVPSFNRDLHVQLPREPEHDQVLKKFQIMNYLVKTSKYSQNSSKTEANNSGSIRSVLRNPFELNENHLLERKVSSECSNNQDNSENEWSGFQNARDGNHRSKTSKISHIADSLSQEKVPVTDRSNTSIQLSTGLTTYSCSADGRKTVSPDVTEPQSDFDFDLEVFMSSPSASFAKPDGVRFYRSNSHVCMNRHNSESNSNVCLDKIPVMSTMTKPSITGETDKLTQSLKTHLVPTTLHYPGHMTKLANEETAMTETIAQELNKVLCSSLQNDFRSSMCRSQAGHLLPTESVNSMTSCCSVPQSEAKSINVAVERQCEHFTSNSCRKQNRDLGRFCIERNSMSEDALDLSNINGRNFVDSKHRQSFVSGQFCSSVVPSFSQTVSSPRRWMAESSRHVDQHPPADRLSYSSPSCSQTNPTHEIRVYSKDEVSILELLKTGEAIKEHGPLNKLLDSCI